jgi:hypothetical protein
MHPKDMTLVKRPAIEEAYHGPDLRILPLFSALFLPIYLRLTVVSFAF